MAKYTPLAFEINLQPEGFMFEVGSLFEAFCALHDPRDARGLRYALVTILVFVVLAKLAGENHLRGIAQWVKLRAVLLATFLALAKPQAPHATTYSRILGKAVALEEFAQVTRDFFARQPKAGTSVVISLDGKTMRGTIPAGQTQGIHLLAAFLPDEGWVLIQVEVGSKENEIPAAARVLMPGFTGQNHYGRCPLGTTGVVAPDCASGWRLHLDHQRQSTGNAPRHCATVCA
jgi:hypothetical protein